MVKPIVGSHGSVATLSTGALDLVVDSAYYSHATLEEEEENSYPDDVLSWSYASRPSREGG